MSEEGKKDSGFLGPVGAGVAGGAAALGIHKLQKDSLVKAALGVTEEAPGKFAEGSRKTFAEAVKVATPKLDVAKFAAGDDKKAVKAAVKAFNTEIQKAGGFFKNMNLLQKGSIIVGAVAAAVVGKKLVDAVIGTRQEGSHVAALESEGAKEAGHAR